MKLGTGIVVVLAAGAVAAPAECLAQTARVRGSRVFAPAKGADLEGVTMADGSVVAWSEVAEVSEGIEDQPEGAADVGRRVWRALSRLERGDAVLAEPELEELFGLYAERTGRTAAEVSAGLLECRLKRGATAAAVAPWLSSVHALEGGGAAGPALGAVHARTGLAPALPPMWLPGPALAAAAALSGVTFEPTSRAGRLAALYLAAARFESGEAVEIDVPTSADEGLALVADVVTARIGDAEVRKEARVALEARLAAERELWEVRWIRLALGRSLLRETAEAERMKGVVELLKVAAENADPALTPMALAEAAVALAEAGHAAEGGRLRRELMDRFPLHAAAEWEPVRNWPPKAKAAGTPAAPAPSGPGVKTENR